MTSGLGGVIQKRPITAVIVAFLLGALALGAVWAAVSAGRPSPEPADSPDVVDPSDEPTPTPQPESAGCGEVTATVADAAGLQAALDSAQPGDVIALTAATYVGNFVMTVSGTADAPITLCGTAESILDGDGTDDGYVVHLDGASYWHLVGFTVTNGQKGVMADGTVGSVIEKLTVHTIGDEAIHLRRMSTDNLVTGNSVSNTGLRRDKFGEGIYIGSAESNWGDITGGDPDTSDRNVIEGNTIWATTAESIDIKEGTSDGVVRGNTFDGDVVFQSPELAHVLLEGNRGAVHSCNAQVRYVRNHFRSGPCSPEDLAGK
jgi:nitrous oxidase accessory protein NosD